MKTKKMHNPYSGRTWEVVTPSPDMNIHPNAVIIIEDGVQKMVSRTYLGMLELENTMIAYDPTLQF